MVGTGAISDHDPDVAYDAANDVFLVACEEDFSSTDHDVKCQLVSGALSVSSVRNGKTGLQNLVAFDAIGPQGTPRSYGALVDYASRVGLSHPIVQDYDLTKMQETPGTTLIQSTPTVDSDGNDFALAFNTFSGGLLAMACSEFSFKSPFKLTESIFCDELPVVTATGSTPLGP